MFQNPEMLHNTHYCDTFGRLGGGVGGTSCTVSRSG
jgi:hypothetical protein